MWEIVNELQRRIEELATRVAQLNSRLTEDEQSTAKLWQGDGGGGSGGTTASYWCRTPGAVAAATGTWPTLTPTTFTADVYSNLGGTLTSVATGATIFWWYKDAAVINKLVPLMANNNGTYDAIADSCTAV